MGPASLHKLITSNEVIENELKTYILVRSRRSCLQSGGSIYFFLFDLQNLRK